MYVVDAGKVKETTYDVRKNITCLDPVWISQASAKQRQGRAGRCATGPSIFMMYSTALLGYSLGSATGCTLDGTMIRCLNTSYQRSCVNHWKSWSFKSKYNTPVPVFTFIRSLWALGFTYKISLANRVHRFSKLIPRGSIPRYMTKFSQLSRAKV